VLILKAAAGEPIPLYGDGGNVRDWLYVEDHVDALLLAATRGELSRSYCVGGHGERTNKQVVEAICALLDERRPSAAPHSALITPVKDRPGHDRRYAIDPRISTELGWQPRHNFEQGLAATVDWYLANLAWCQAVRERAGYGGGRLLRRSATAAVGWARAERAQGTNRPRPYGAADASPPAGAGSRLTLRLTNTLTRAKSAFVPLQAGKVSIYCCGVTVYDLCHLGHARSYIVWDVLRRYLIWMGYQVTFVQNYTDIDDKILARAAAEGSTMEAVSERNIAAYISDMAALNILPADRMPRATRCLDAIRTLIGDLEAKGAAYSVDGDVYFAVLKHRDYGKLSGRDLTEQQDNASGRVATAEEARKHHPFDFALWKGAKPGEPSFPSPWGPGRPGWHIECSAMVREELGTTIDIHLGGADLIFPHHENEIAQSEAASGQELARWWLHNGMVNVGGEKMSKSLGNFTTIRALLDSGVSPMTLRLFVLQANYRKPLDFSAEALEAAATGWKGLNAALALAGPGTTPTPETDPSPALAAAGAGRGEGVGEAGWPDLAEARGRFQAAMDDDLNTAAALAVLFELARPLRSLANRLERGDQAAAADAATAAVQEREMLLAELAGVLGLVPEPPAEARGPEGEEVSGSSWIPEAEIMAQIEARKGAKAARDFTRADAIRATLRDQGIELIDRPGGVTEWLRG